MCLGRLCLSSSDIMIRLKPKNFWIKSKILGPLLSSKRSRKMSSDFLSRRLRCPFRDPSQKETSSDSRETVSFHVMDGRRLRDYVDTTSFKVDAVAVFDLDSETGTSAVSAIRRALGNLTVEQGMPPCDDSWVAENIVNPALESAQKKIHPRHRFSSVSEFVQSLRIVALDVGSLLEKKPVTVATTQKTFDGKSIDQFLGNKNDLKEALQTTWKSLPKDHRGAMPREYLRVALDIICPAAGLPPLGSVGEMDRVYVESFMWCEVDIGGAVNQKEFRKVIVEMLGHIRDKLELKPVIVSYNKVLHDNSEEPRRSHKCKISHGVKK